MATGLLPPVTAAALLLLLLPMVLGDDVNALLLFKESLGNSGALNKWVAGGNPCPPPRPQWWPGVLCNNGSVTGLQLEKMSLTGLVDVEALLGIRQLRSLSVRDNFFDGPIPNVSRLGALKAIYLANNNFSGVIPADAFDRMGSLKKVVLSHNQFTGPIPSSLARVPKLLELWLDNNQFTGQLPDLRQPTLRVVNVANNELEGPIPADYSRFDAGSLSYAGNEGLCGKPLDKSCKSKKKMSGTLLIIIIALGVALGLGGLGAMFLLLRWRSASLPRTHEFSPTSGKKAAARMGHKQEAGAGAKEINKNMHENGKLVFFTQDTQRFELQDLLRASAEVLGSGNFGSSYKAVLLSGPAMVVKRFRVMNGAGREEFHQHLRRLGRLSHPNVLPLVAYYYRKEEKLVVTNFIENGSLMELLHSNRSPDQQALDWPTRLRIVKGVARGLAYLHDELSDIDIPHGHLKSSNVLLGDNYEPLLMDYGLVSVTNKEQARQLLVAYKSPEYHRHGQVSKKSDVWNLGNLILEILTGRFPSNYLAQGKGTAKSDLAHWVNSVVREEWTGEVFDNEMVGSRRGEDDMLKLLQIGLACCEVSVSKRWELRDVVEKIEGLNERANDESSFAGEDIYSSRAMTDDDFSFSVAK